MYLNVKCGFCSSDLKRRLTKTGFYFCNTSHKGLWQKRQREELGFTKEWLWDQYFNKGKTCNDIAREINRDSKRVWEWFKDYGIKIKGRGMHELVHFKKGRKDGIGKLHKASTKEKIRQARIRDGHVPYLKNGIHWLKHPGAISGMWKGGITPQRQSVYSSIEWVEAVKKVWARDNAICQKCGKHHNTEKNRGSFHIHHITSFMVVEKRTDPNNLVLLCKDCHKWVHSKKNTDRLWLKIN